MSNYCLQAEKVDKKYGRRLIFKDIDFNFTENGIYGISGKNGAGKSTLINIIAGIISPSSGKITHKENDILIKAEELHNKIGFVAPYLVMYEEFSAWENFKHISNIREIKLNQELIKSLLNDFLLFNRRNDLVKTYSSGMKQRLKFIFALSHSPNLLLLDEPTSNLDDTGKKKVYEIVEREAKEKIVIIASNEKADLDLCSQKIILEEFK